MSSAYNVGGGGSNLEDPLERLIWQTDLANKQGGVNYFQQILDGFWMALEERDIFLNRQDSNS